MTEKLVHLSTRVWRSPLPIFSRSIIATLSIVFMAVPFVQNTTYAEYRYWPGGTAYFRGDVTQRMVQRDRMWDTIDDEIHIKAVGNHAK